MIVKTMKRTTAAARIRNCGRDRRPLWPDEKKTKYVPERSTFVEIDRNFALD